MSTGLECVIEETQPGRWFYILERWDAPKNAWDWREHADTYGPFDSEDAAIAHLQENHPNPGGFWVAPYRPAGDNGA